MITKSQTLKTHHNHDSMLISGVITIFVHKYSVSPFFLFSPFQRQSTGGGPVMAMMDRAGGQMNPMAPMGPHGMAGMMQQPPMYQPPAALYDDDPGIMSEVETSATGLRRGAKARSSLPIVRTPNKTNERPLGMLMRCHTFIFISFIFVGF